MQQLQSSAESLYDFSLLCLHNYVIYIIHYNSQIQIISLKLKYILKDNWRMEIMFTDYFFIIILLFIVIILLLFLCYLDNDSGASNKKGDDTIDLTD